MSTSVTVRSTASGAGAGEKVRASDLQSCVPWSKLTVARSNCYRHLAEGSTQSCGSARTAVRRIERRPALVLYSFGVWL